MIDSIIRLSHSIEIYLCDPIILKLLLIISTLSTGINRFWNFDDGTNCDKDENRLKIFKIQNDYVNLLWQYISFRLCSEERAVRYLNELILFIFCLQKVSWFFDERIGCCRDELEKMEPLMRTMWP